MANQSRPKAIMGYLAAIMACPAFTARFATDLVRPDLLERICGKRLICADTLRKAWLGISVTATNERRRRSIPPRGSRTMPLGLSIRRTGKAPMARQQLDLFGEEPEPDLFGPDYEPPVWRADPDRVRAKLHRILAEARAAERLPWDADRAGYYRTMFPQMALSLPQEGAAQLRFAFETEMARLEAA